MLHAVRAAIHKAGLWSVFGSWVLLDGEVLPWTLKWGDLALSYGGIAATASVHNELARERQAQVRHHPDAEALAPIVARGRLRADNLCSYASELRKYTSDSRARYAPFGILASEGKMWSSVSHEEQLGLIGSIVKADVIGLTESTRWEVTSTDPDEVLHAVLQLSVGGSGEGVVVKPVLPLLLSGRT